MAKKSLPLKATIPAGIPRSRATGAGQATPTQPVSMVGSVDVNIQDQYTHPLMVKANQVTGGSTLATPGNLNENIITVVDPSTMNEGDYLGIFDLTGSGRYYVGYIITISGNDLLLDSRLDFDFPVGSVVGTGITNLSVDGSIDHQHFGFRGADPGVGITVDVTRILFTGLASTALSFAGFGDGDSLINGFLVRHIKDSYTKNIVNFKTNLEMKGWMLDWQPLDDPSPAVKLQGFVARLTFTGQEKLGVALRVGPGESLDFVVQDDLTSRLLSLEVMVEGHEVDYS